jgi:hypothetical protein
VRHDKQLALLKSQRSILKMQEALRQAQDAIQKEEQAFFALVSAVAKESRINPKKYTFDVDKLVFVPNSSK